MRFSQYVDIAKSLIDKPNSPHKHFSLIIYKNRIRSIGWNNKSKTHSLLYNHGYDYPFIHSEASAIIRFDGKPKELAHCAMVNIRLGINGQLMNSRPCIHCIRLLNTFHFKRVFYTNKYGQFVEM